MNKEEVGIPKISPTLAENPTENYVEWIKSVRQLFASLMIAHYPYGLLHLVVPAAEFSTYPLNFDRTDPENPIPIDAPNPIPPGPLAAGAGAGAVHMHKEIKDIHVEYTKLSATGRLILIDSLGPDIREEITDHAAGSTITTTIPDIMAHVRIHYGTRTAEDIRRLRDSLREPIAGQDVGTFLTFSVKFKNTVGKLAAAGQALSQFDQLDYFFGAIMGQPGIADAARDYVKANPNLADRNLNNIVTFVRAQLANATASSLGYAGSAKEYATNAPMPAPSDVPFAGLTIADVSKAIDAALNKRLGNIPPTARKEQGNQRATHYCYRHGYNNSHPGRDCNAMKADTSTYSPAMLTAKNPTQVPGGHK